MGVRIAHDWNCLYFYQYEMVVNHDKFSFLETIYEGHMPQFETEHKGSTIKVASTIVRGGKYCWSVLIDGVLQQPPAVEPSGTWNSARDQGLTFAKNLIDAGK
ncbi:hypothetical protein [Collimonas sp.]|jgi:hypothetical protein|uniref:hypothetical protein n=1 Tax=Collimonas sp. TaxID=1963772 RepID=UPI002D09CF7D|nr:hypothetical protein [Collimonas sp.]HWW08304.1 hypothetical protein [Collimonas sp.]